MSCKSFAFGVSLACLLAAAPAMAQQGAATGPLSARIGHYDPSRMRRATGVHEGAGAMEFGPLLGAQALSTNLIFLHRGIILPHSGIGEHFHNACEEMFVILDGADAQFTVNASTLHHRHKITPYAGEELSGVVQQTYLRGKKIYDRDHFPDAPLGHMLLR